MSTVWRKGRLVLFGLLFVLSLSIASLLSIVPAKTAVAGPVPFQANYYNNMTLSGTPVLTRLDTNVNFDWGIGSPDPKVSADHFSARWIRNVSLNAGMYKFTVTADDGVRLFFDGAPIIDHWVNQPATTYSRTVWVTQGTHSIIMEYYENTQVATAKFSFQQV
jgi:hypothetical protein